MVYTGIYEVKNKMYSKLKKYNKLRHLNICIRFYLERNCYNWLLLLLLILSVIIIDPKIKPITTVNNNNNNREMYS